MNFSRRIAGLFLFVMMALNTAEAAEFDGHWYVTKMVCNGEKANAKTRSLYTKPNYISVDIHGSTGAFIDGINGCRKIIPLAFNYLGTRHMTASFSGPIECYPANCDTGCGLLLPLTVAYEVERRKNTLIWNSIGPVDDNCAKGGQSDPITYWMHEQR